MSDEFDPLTGDPLPETNATKAKTSVTTQQQSPLSAEEIADLTDDDLRKMCRESLAMMIHGNKGKLASSGAIRELLDRMDGKPAQSIAMTVKTDPISKLSDARLLRLESELARMTGQEAIVIQPEPKKLED